MKDPLDGFAEQQAIGCWIIVAAYALFVAVYIYYVALDILQK